MPVGSWGRASPPPSQSFAQLHEEYKQLKEKCVVHLRLLLVAWCCHGAVVVLTSLAVRQVVAGDKTFLPLLCCLAVLPLSALVWAQGHTHRHVA